MDSTLARVRTLKMRPDECRASPTLLLPCQSRYLSLCVALVVFRYFQYMLHAAWALFLAFNVFFNYFHCAFTHPGKPDAFLPRNAVSDSDDDLTCDDEDVIGTR